MGGKPDWRKCCKKLLGRGAASQPRASQPPSGRGDRKRVNALTRWEVTRNRSDLPSPRWRSLAYRERPEPIPSFRGPVEDPPPVGGQRTGICCSGGGIRSAAFNLGALQALQCEEELQRSSYLAAVSGGSYIAAAFAMVATKREQGLPPRCSDDSDPELIDSEPPFSPGSPEEQYLRNRSSYLAPDGFGKLFLIYRLVLGLLFNIVFISAPLFAVMLMAGWGIYRNVYTSLINKGVYHVPLGCWIVPAALAGLSILVGLFVMLWRLEKDRTRRGLQILSTRLMIAAVLVAFFSIGLPELLVFTVHVRESLPGALRESKASSEKGVSGIVLTGSGLAGLIAGALAYVRETLLTPERALKALEQGKKAFGSRVRTLIVNTAAAAAGPLLLVGVLALALSLSLTPATIEDWWVVPWPVLLGVGMLVLFAAFYYFADLTTWSLHPFYKRQLCTAFALKRVKAADAYRLSDGQVQQLKKSVSGREFLDSPVAVERSYKSLVKLSKTALDGKKLAAAERPWPCLIVCAAANVSDPGATPPGRPVTSFTFSARSVGGPLIGAVETEPFEDAFGGTRRRRDLTLPAAVAISGAAVAPSMGKLTRPSLRFLLALANIRLGVWVPNPRSVQGQAAGAAGFRGWRGRPRASYLIRELIGRNRVDGRYLFVTDGGHYENLGLVELLRRGCTEIYCVDASNDNEFGVLGDAVALARSELGVEIDIDLDKLRPAKEDSPATATAPARKTGIAEDCVAKGTFHYRGAGGCGRGREGVLIYTRCVMTDKAPPDVKAHHSEDPAFPHNSTADQLYTDQKFESYRALGQHSGEYAIKLMQQARSLRLSASARPPAGAPRAPGV